jgi:ribonuclease HII
MPKSAVQLKVVPKPAPAKRKQRTEDSTPKLEQLLSFDAHLRRTYRFRTMIGLDEVGRGCLAGPVVACAVVLPNIGKRLSKALELLNDSKQVSPDNRAKLAVHLRKCTKYGIGSASVEEIDKINIYYASLLAMRRAVEALVLEHLLEDEAPVLVLDGKAKIPDIIYKQLPVIGGDAQSASVAAASIIAKVHRDTFMVNLSKEMPHYNWHSNKGYRCATHVEAIGSHGITIWHRRTFLRKYGYPFDGAAEEIIDAEEIEIIEQLPLFASAGIE